VTSVIFYRSGKNSLSMWSRALRTQ